MDPRLAHLIQQTGHVTVLNIDSRSTVVILQMPNRITEDHLQEIVATAIECLPPELAVMVIDDQIGITIVRRQPDEPDED